MPACACLHIQVKAETGVNGYAVYGKLATILGTHKAISTLKSRIFIFSLRKASICHHCFGYVQRRVTCDSDRRTCTRRLMRKKKKTQQVQRHTWTKARQKRRLLRRTMAGVDDASAPNKRIDSSSRVGRIAYSAPCERAPFVIGTNACIGEDGKCSFRIFRNSLL